MPAPAAGRYFAREALLADGWARDVSIAVDADGRIASIETGAEPSGTRLAGPVLPPVADVHSHAFQRAFAGLANRAGPDSDSFWTWREIMYRLVGRLTPDDAGAIAAKLMVELLKGGYGRLAEFHYLHKNEDGRPYADPSEMARRILAASALTGMPVTLIPTFYAHADFGGAPPTPGQRRFLHSVDGFLDLMQRLEAPCREAGARLGMAIHSLRAATEDEIAALLTAYRGDGPLHIHVAEQRREVEACLAHCSRRPVERLFELAPVDERWCLIHATHLASHEVAMIAASGAVVGLCPSTEADLGDGLFPAEDYLAAGGRFGLGSDSHVGVSVAQELRLLEWGQRLRSGRRNVLAGAPSASTGRRLYDLAHAGGARASGADASGIAIGAPADLVVLDDRLPEIAAVSGDDILDRWIFTDGGRTARDVMIGGRFLVEGGRHVAEDAVDRAYAAALARLFG